MTIDRVALVSLEPWDDVWRRNQHLALNLVASGAVKSILFIEPPAGGFALDEERREVLDGIVAIRPPLRVPRRYGGWPFLSAWLRRAVRAVDLLWINDPVAGAGALGPTVSAIYDVTDDWRAMPQRDRDRERIVRSEDRLAGRARTVVCSEVLAERWSTRYGVAATVVPNGVDVAAVTAAVPMALDGAGPHFVYVGTLHENRIDADLVADLAAIGTVHLVGPNHLAESTATRLLDCGARLHGPVPSAQVPGWLVAADVLVCPHLVDDFTLSLDAIKAHEYLATDRPVVATPSCGFQSLRSDGLAVVPATHFVDAAAAAATLGPVRRTTSGSWANRAEAFAQELSAAVRG